MMHIDLGLASRSTEVWTHGTSMLTVSVTLTATCMPQARSGGRSDVVVLYRLDFDNIPLWFMSMCPSGVDSIPFRNRLYTGAKLRTSRERTQHRKHHVSLN